jgi:hypothetical protein
MMRYTHPYTFCHCVCVEIQKRRLRIEAKQLLGFHRSGVTLAISNVAAATDSSLPLAFVSLCQRLATTWGLPIVLDKPEKTKEPKEQSKTVFDEDLTGAFDSVFRGYDSKIPKQGDPFTYFKTKSWSQTTHYHGD